MNFELTEELTSFREDVLRFARTALSDDVVARDREGAFSREAWDACARFGIQGLPVPGAFGGGGADALTVIVAMEALGYVCKDNGLLFSLNAQMWSCQTPIVSFGTELQKQRYLPGLCDGTLIGVQAMSEPESGSDAFSLKTTAREGNDGYVLKGTKTFVTNGPIADVFVVFASTHPERGFAGISAFLVERGSKGLSIGPPMEKMGLRTSPMSQLFLDDCEVDRGQMLGAPGAGMAIFNSSMDWERSCILASVLGTMERQLEEAIGYARERKQFGKPIGKFQAVAHRIVDMKVRLEAARLLIYRLGWLKGQGRSTAVESAMVKLYLSESFLQSSLDALQTFGGYGYMTESEIERTVRDAIGGRIYSGTSDIQRNIIAAHLGL